MLPIDILSNKHDPREFNQKISKLIEIKKILMNIQLFWLNSYSERQRTLGTLGTLGTPKNMNLTRRAVHLDFKLNLIEIKEF